VSGPRPTAARRSPAATRPSPAATTAVAFAALVGLFLGLPVVVLMGRALVGGGVGAALGAAAVVDALALSLATTSASLVVTVALGTPLAWLLARRRFPGSALVETIVDLPIVLPPSVAGLALLLVFGRRGLLGEPLETVGLEIAFTTFAVVLAQTFVAAPFYIRSARAGFAAVDADLEDAARVDGADDVGVARHVTLPLAGAALAAGLVMSWARALGEFGATILFAGNLEGLTQTLPLAVYAEFQAGDLDAAIAAAAILVAAAFGVLVAVRSLHWGRALDLRSAGRLAGGSPPTR
jgi:molybdate transport system permease protein